MTFAFDGIGKAHRYVRDVVKGGHFRKVVHPRFSRNGTGFLCGAARALLVAREDGAVQDVGSAKWRHGVSLVAAVSLAVSPLWVLMPTAHATTHVRTARPPFVVTASSVPDAEVHFTWRPGCPVGPVALRLLRLSYMGFDHRSHLGEIIVNRAVVVDVVEIFRTLYLADFPIHSMEPEDVFKGSDPASMAADNTSGFNCRYAVAPGRPQWSVHAYGEAIDVNPVQNPYLEGGKVQPSAGSAYLNRSLVRPGMAEAGGTLVAAFSGVGWYWGGRWSTSPDYQHFSLTGG